MVKENYIDPWISSQKGYVDLNLLCYKRNYDTAWFHILLWLICQYFAEELFSHFGNLEKWHVILFSFFPFLLLIACVHICCMCLCTIYVLVAIVDPCVYKCGGQATILGVSLCVNYDYFLR